MKNFIRNIYLNSLSISLLFVLIFNLNTQAQNQDWLNLDTIKAGKFDTGRMWTFEYPPVDYFEEAYSFRPGEEWFDEVRMAALRFATYCSASFVSEDGLVMTNHHCGRQSITQVTGEGENLHETGFIAESLEDERPVPGLFVDQLVLIKDVTDEVLAETDKASDEKERLEIEASVISEIESREAENSGLEVSVTALYNGARYSLYGYKRYTDVRLVFAPEHQLGFFGGDPDNFTYPRYNLDCSFFRVYDENGEPLKTNHYFKWSEKGATEGEAIFVVGNPGNTDRLNTVAQLEYQRDIQYPRTLDLLSGLIETYSEMIEQDPEGTRRLKDMLLSFQNSQKAYTGMLGGLQDPVLMQRKKDFEKTFKQKVQSDPELNELYGGLWDKIEKSRAEIRKISNKNFALSMNRFTTPQYFFIAEEMIALAEELTLPENERSELYVGDELDITLESFIPEDFDYDLNRKLLKEKIHIFNTYFGKDESIIQEFTQGKTGDEAVESVLERSSLTSTEDIKELASKGPDGILNSDDPFIQFILNTDEISAEYDERINELVDKEATYTQQLGRALFAVYGTSIPPDATFTLRISDGIVEGFPYNGTVAPPITTFYGLYDRYYSHGKEFPWSLPARWLNPPDDFDLSTPFNFVSTNDIIGGNSGSPVINKDKEVVGLAFDGNVQGLPGNFIFRTEENRMVSVHSEGMMEAIKDLYKYERLADELKTGKLSD